MTTTRREEHNPSLWAFILIALGVIWLLFEAKIISSANLVVLFRLWPLVLIAFGLELLIGRSSRQVSLLIGLGTIVLLLVLMLVGPAFGLAPTAEVKNATYSAPVESETSAQVNLGLSVGHATVQALTDSNDLISADLRYVGDVNFRVDGTTNKIVTLTAKNDNVQVFDFLGLSLNSDQSSLHWNIGLSPKIPLDLHINGGVGDSTIDLSGLQVAALNYRNGVGDSTISLPGSGHYNVSLNGGVGKLTVNFADGAAIQATVEAGVGDILLHVPSAAPVHLEAHGGLGDVTVPSNFTRTSGTDSGLDRSGVWETSNYAAADGNRITIIFNGGVGKLTIQ